MNNDNNSSFKIQNSQRRREIENQLEREITGIVNKQKMFSSPDKRYQGMSENVSSKLKSFLDERLSKKDSNQRNYNEEAYYRSLDYNKNSQDSRYKSNFSEEDNYYYEEDAIDDEYYEDENYDGYDDYYDEDIKKDKLKNNHNSYLPFTYEELQPEMPSSEELEKMFLDAMMPAIAQWLDINIDRIVHKVVRETLSNRGMQEKDIYGKEFNNYSKEYSTTYARSNKDYRNNELDSKVEKSRFSDRTVERGKVKNKRRAAQRSSSVNNIATRSTRGNVSSSNKVTAISKEAISGVIKSSSDRSSKNLKSNDRNTIKR